MNTRQALLQRIAEFEKRLAKSIEEQVAEYKQQHHDTKKSDPDIAKMLGGDKPSAPKAPEKEHTDDRGEKALREKHQDYSKAQTESTQKGVKPMEYPEYVQHKGIDPSGKQRIKEKGEFKKQHVPEQIGQKVKKAPEHMGNVPTGKKLYDVFEHPEHKDFSPQDHASAAGLHRSKMKEMQGKHGLSHQGFQAPGQPKHPEFLTDRAKYFHHYENMNKHKAQAGMPTGPQGLEHMAKVIRVASLWAKLSALEAYLAA